MVISDEIFKDLRWSEIETQIELGRLNQSLISLIERVCVCVASTTTVLSYAPSSKKFLATFDTNTWKLLTTWHRTHTFQYGEERRKAL